MQSKLCKIFLTKSDSYLDLTYWDSSIIYWDNEKVNKNNVASLNFSDALFPLIDLLESTGEKLELTLYISEQSVVDNLQNISGQNKLKVSKLNSAMQLCKTEKEAKRLKTFLSFHNVETYKI